MILTRLTIPDGMFRTCTKQSTTSNGIVCDRNLCIASRNNSSHRLPNNESLMGIAAKKVCRYRQEKIIPQDTSGLILVQMTLYPPYKFPLFKI